jgi:ubiquinone/menaquinone biosynthesis C-methylase UbiE
MSEKNGAPVTPDRVMQMAWGFGATRTLCTALELDVFTKIAEGATTAKALVGATKSSPRGLPMLLDALVAMGFVERKGTGDAAVHSLAADAATFLVKTSPAYIGDFVLFHGHTIDDHWRKLTDCVKTGKPVVAVDKPAEGIPLWHELVDTLFTLGFLGATQVGKELGRLHPKGEIRLLDVAAGSGVWGIGAATAEPRMRVVVQDLPETLEHAKKHVARHHLEPRVEYLAGDLRSMEFGKGAFHAATLGHIVHSEGAAKSADLLQKVSRALVPGGTIVIIDFVPDPGRSSPPLPLLFALNMLVHTSDGSTYTFPEYETWLKKAGFRDVRQMPAAAPSPLILATKA